MSQRHTVMLLSRPYTPDVRAEKEAHTLAAAGWRVSVVAWDREGRYSPHMRAAVPDALVRVLASQAHKPGGVTVTHIAIRAGYRTGPRLLYTIPQFWWRAWIELCRLQPDVVHAHDLDTLPVAVAYRARTGARVVFDAREYYPGMVQASVGRPLSRALDALERWLIPQVDAVLTVGERLAQRYQELGTPTWIVHNAQPLPDVALVSAQRRAFRRQMGVPDDALLVVYVGYLNPDRLIAPILDAMPDVARVWFAVGGSGPHEALLQAAASHCDRIRSLGWVALADVPAVVAASDAVYYGLDADNPNSQYFMPNLAFYAWAAGRPILTTPVGEIADVVAREGCGIVLESATRAAARAALAQLCEAADRDRLTQNARSVGQRLYHWGQAADELLKAYRHVDNVKNC